MTKKTRSEETIIDNRVFTIEETFYEVMEGMSSCDYRLIIKPRFRQEGDPYEIRLCGESFREFLREIYKTLPQSNTIVRNT
tara:strand:+ start:354 stop:596 length:243 start_codon:yes stop_codon:yes gene_type:complete